MISAISLQEWRRFRRAGLVVAQDSFLFAETSLIFNLLLPKFLSTGNKNPSGEVEGGF